MFTCLFSPGNMLDVARILWIVELQMVGILWVSSMMQLYTLENSRILWIVKLQALALPSLYAFLRILWIVELQMLELLGALCIMEFKIWKVRALSKCRCRKLLGVFASWCSKFWKSVFCGFWPSSPYWVNKICLELQREGSGCGAMSTPHSNLRFTSQRDDSTEPCLQSVLYIFARHLLCNNPMSLLNPHEAQLCTTPCTLKVVPNIAFCALCKSTEGREREGVDLLWLDLLGVSNWQVVLLQGNFGRVNSNRPPTSGEITAINSC